MAKSSSISRVFASLSIHNYKIWFFSSIVSNLGTNIQRTAQDWLVVAVLTSNSGLDLGIIMALQFGPQLLLMPITGSLLDKLNLRHILVWTQIIQALLAFSLAGLLLFDLVNLLVVEGFALLLGIVGAIDTTARHSIVTELVPKNLLINGISLNAASFNLGRLAGPAVAGILIALIGIPFSFIINGFTFFANVFVLIVMRKDELYPRERIQETKGAMKDVFNYLGSRYDIISLYIVLFFISLFGLNFQIYISKMATSVFDQGAESFGILTSLIGLGATIGAIYISTLKDIKLKIAFIAAGLFSLFLALSAISPLLSVFGLTLIFVGYFSQICTSAINTYIQSSSDAIYRGRIMAIFMAIYAGATPFGAPLMGWMTDFLGSRLGILSGAALTILPIFVVYLWLKDKKSIVLKTQFPHRQSRKRDTFKLVMHSVLSFDFIFAVDNVKSAWFQEPIKEPKSKSSQKSKEHPEQ